jgi:hypothetical protein
VGLEDFLRITGALVNVKPLNDKEFLMNILKNHSTFKGYIFAIIVNEPFIIFLKDTPTEWPKNSI